MLSLRPYQLDAVAATMRELERAESTLVVLATGLGKTVVAAEIAHVWEQGRVMFVAHRQELIAQAARKIHEVTGERPAIEQGERASNETLLGRSQFVVASKDSLHEKRLARFDDIGLLFIDEAHRAARKNRSYTRIYELLRQKNPRLKMIGLTATPRRHDGSAMGQVFQTVAYQYEIEPAVGDGWLAPIVPLVVKIESLDLSEVHSRAGDLDRGELARVLEEEKTVQGMAYATVREARERRRVLVFTAGVQQAKDLCGIINRHEPDTARWLSGDKRECPDDLRRSVLEQFGQGRIKYLLNCGLFLEGFDEPAIDMLVMARPTKSIALYTQMIGRGTRALPGVVDGPATAEVRQAAIAASAKPNCLCLDFVDNSRRHKLVSSVDVLGGKWDDATRAAIKRVIERASESGRRLSLDEAAAELVRQRQQAQAAAEAEKQRKRAAIALRARYRVEQTNPFDSAETTAGGRPQRTPVMPFGRHRGERIGSLSTNYIRTFLEHVPATRTSAWVFKALVRELARRGEDEGSRFQVPGSKSDGGPTSSTWNPEPETWNSSAPATEAQQRVLALYHKPPAATMSEAAARIEEINEELRSKVQSPKSKVPQQGDLMSK